MVAAVAGTILIEGRVEHPVLGIFDPPMAAHGAGEACSAKWHGGDIVAADGAGFAIAHDLGFDHAQGGEAWQAGLVRVAPIGKQPVHVMADQVPAGLDAAMIGIDGGMGFEAGGLGIGEQCGDFGQHGWTVRLQREQPLSAACRDQP